MPRWGMVIDLQRCIGCYSCMISCKQEHFLPPGMFWSRVIVSETGSYPMVSKHMYPVGCNHCKDAACVKACPTRATTRRADGLVIVDSDKCAGCRYCVIACPYQQRTFHSDGKKEYFPGQGLTEYEVMGRKLYPLQNGTVVKCNFCAERIDRGMKKGLKPGLDREATPACVIACSPKARYFGDLDDPNAEVSILIREKNGFQLHPEYGTDPSVYYIT
jgi:phenylacetyl-CoA:acceptor oxidoreductase 27-kDa subunit